MNEGGHDTTMGRHIATTLRVGTLLAVAATGVGYVLVAIGDRPDAPHTRLIENLAAGGGESILAAGLLTLTLTPLVAVVVAAFDLARAGERVRALTAAAVAVLLGAALFVAIAVNAAPG